MRRLIIKNLGPIDSLDIELSRKNIIIGPQSSGKSCVLKTVCHCVWVEKRIELTQTAEYFKKEGVFIEDIELFHKFHGYIKNDTYIAYESDFMKFSYNNATQTFSFEWKEKRWDYRKTKISYIPAERNLVATIPNWFDIKLPEDNIRSFMRDWETARKESQEEVSVLNLGVSYRYDKDLGKDRVLLGEEQEAKALELTNTSSGLQSLIPLFVHLNYLKDIWKHRPKTSLTEEEEKETLKQAIYKKFVGNNVSETPPSEMLAEKVKNYLEYHYCDIFLEEPESNLFPPTQASLVRWLRELAEGEHACNLFLATHSPYVLTAFIEQEDPDLGLFYVRNAANGKSEIVKATEQQISEINDFGIDAFINIESL